MSISNLYVSKNLDQDLKVRSVEANSIATNTLIVDSTIDVLDINAEQITSINIDTTTFNTSFINGLTVPTTNIVGVDDSQTLKNKTMNYAQNTFVGFPGDTNYPVSKFTVGPSLTYAAYTNIQTAINAANTEFISTSKKQSVYIQSNEYTANLIFKNGVDIIGIGDSVVINGVHSYSTVTASISINNIKFNGIATGIISANVAGEITFNNCIFNQGSCVNALIQDSGVGTGTLIFNKCEIETLIAGTCATFGLSSGNVEFNDCKIIGSSYSAYISVPSCIFYNCYYSDLCDFDCAYARFYNCDIINVPSLPAISFIGGVMEVVDCIFDVETGIDCIAGNQAYINGCVYRGSTLYGTNPTAHLESPISNSYICKLVDNTVVNLTPHVDTLVTGLGLHLGAFNNKLGNMFTVGNSYINIPVTGIYLVNAWAGGTSAGTGQNLQTTIYADANPLVQQSNRGQDAYLSANCAAIVSLTAGMKLYLYVKCSAITVNVGSTTNESLAMTLAAQLISL